MKPHWIARLLSRPTWALSLLCFGMFAATPATAVDIASSPLVTSASAQVKPNLMFILDDSSSMSATFMPVEVKTYFKDKYGYVSAQCNGVYYDPAITYTPPVKSDGTSYAAATFTAAWRDGYNTSSTKIDLSKDFQPDMSEPSGATTYAKAEAYYYKYTGAETLATQKTYTVTTSTFYKECASNIGSNPGLGVFTKVTVAASEQQNFANWFSYYRTRMLAMKTALSHAFSAVDDTYRVGYMTINNSAGSDFLNISDFNATQKSNWYAKLFAASPTIDGTPLRSALATAGLLYAGALTGTFNGSTVVDPVQESCQQNFTLLSTDGYWNAGYDSGCSGRSGAGCKTDLTSAVGNQDGTAARPLFDGSNAATTSVTDYTRNTYSKTKDDCTGINRKLKTQPEKATYSVTTINGVVQAGVWSAWSINGSAVISGSCGSITLPSPNPSAEVAGATTTSTSASGGSSDSLADVAMYYYETDLRPTMTNNVNTTATDTATHQHMTTFTLGLGAPGTMTFSNTYATDTGGDFYNVKVGTQNNGAKSPCSWSPANSACDWPVPVSNEASAIDDLWHAAVNGRGTYFAATNSATLSEGLSSALSGLSKRLGSSAAATTSNPNVTSGDNFLFSSSFETVDWTGQLERYEIDTVTGALSSSANWSAQGQLDGRITTTTDSRIIHTYDPTGGGDKLKDFLWTNLTSTEKTYFNSPAIDSLSQWTGLSTGDKTTAQGENLLKFLRGQRQYEGSLYRTRAHALGDIVSSEGVYVKAPPFSYSDAGYYLSKDVSNKDFKTEKATRAGRFYVGANDGMLHAFNADSGAEEWAYIPSILLSNLFKLADDNYANNHRFYVDGTPVSGDICPNAPSSICTAAQWKTILVGGFNGGGKGYYALDVTDPNAPKALWEFTANTGAGTGYTTDANLGSSFGNPIITKLADGTWVVLLTSGYNNADGYGHLYVLNANTGAKIADYSTGTASAFAKINAWTDNATSDNLTKWVYGGDIEGNLWRFDVNGTLGTAGAFKLATVKGPNNIAQPITVKPELGLVGNTHHVIYFGTGKFLGQSDYSDTTQASPNKQSFYALKDPLNLLTTYTATPRGAASTGGVQSRTITTSGATRSVSGAAVDWGNATAGWYFDLPDSGERNNTDPVLALGTIVFTTNIPTSTSCTIGGESWLYYLDYDSGLAASADGIIGEKLANSLSSRPNVVRLPGGELISYERLGDGTTIISDIPIDPSSSSLRRISWRELITE